MSKNNIVYRNVEIRLADENSNVITGQAIVFDSLSRDLGGFKEIIRASAISQELIDSSDVAANINHDNNQLLARWHNGQGTLKLDLREDGLWFAFEAPDTERGRELLWNIRNGNLSECSFAFTLPPKKQGEHWYEEDGEMRREITQITGLYDVSVVYLAAYPATSVDNREIIDLEMIKRSLEEEKAEAARAEAEKKKDEVIGILDIRLKDFLGKINI